jgi:hypothetical protein
VFLELLHLEGRAPVVHLQDPDEVGYREHTHKPEIQINTNGNASNSRLASL